MTQEDAEHVGVLIARAWAAPAGELLIRVTYRRDVLSTVETTFVATKAEEVCTEVERWLALIRGR